VSAFDLSTRRGRLATYLHHIIFDHAFLRITWTNTHWISDEVVRANQPWPYQVKRWRDRGIRTIINLRGRGVDSHHVLERDACERYGIKQVDIINLGSREAPTREQVLAAKAMFDEIEYPALIHCKSGADRAGVMSALYVHFRQKKPISEAIGQLDFWKFGHISASDTGVMDYAFQKYMREVEPLGISYEDWVRSDAYDPVAIKKEFRSKGWARLITNNLLRRE
jgi:protein tyrosine/serine phosphatase